MNNHDLPPSIANRLQTYRNQIDALDNQLISLFKERIQIVSQVGEMKRKETDLRCLIRSGREAEMVRRIYHEFKDSNFLPEAAAAIWRLIISASTHHETPLRLALPEALSSTASDYFGSFIPQTHCTAEEAVMQAAQQPSTIALIPTDTVIDFPDHLKIFALLPFIPTKTNLPQAYAVAQLWPEETDEDVSLFSVKLRHCEPECSEGEAIQSLLASLNCFVAYAPRNDGDSWLIGLHGFHTQLPLDSCTTRWLGSYAVPIT